MNRRERVRWLWNGIREDVAQDRGNRPPKSFETGAMSPVYALRYLMARLRGH